MSQNQKRSFESFSNGSKWVRADFHLHTRADKHFSYNSNQPEYPPESTFAKEFVAKLKEQNINLGIISNHNKFDKEEFSKLRTNAFKEEIYLLPAVELTVNDGANGIHTIVVFSDEWLDSGDDYINQFLNVAFQGKTSRQYEQNDGKSSLGLIDTIKKLNEYNRDYFIVFAHVEQSNGLWNELNGGRIKDLGQEELFRERTLAFQKVRTYDKEGKVSREKVKDWFDGWYPAEVEGSDCKSLGDIGAKNGETWIKIGDYSFEAVKFALIDHPNRVSSQRPDGYRHSYIQSISFIGGTLSNKTIDFSPELNTIIGIRGSGKSSILEALRYGLNIPFGEKGTDEKYKKDLISYTLGSGGQVIIKAVDKFGSEYEIKRILNEAPNVFFDGKLQPGVSIRESVVRNPIYFGQKDLSSSGEGFENDLVEKLLGDSLYDIRRRIATRKQIVTEAVKKFLNLNSLDEKIEEHSKEMQDAEFNLKKFKEYGIEDKFRKQVDFNTDERRIKQMVTDLKELINHFDNLLTDNEEPILSHLHYSSEQNQDFFNHFLKEYGKVVPILEQQKVHKVTLADVLKNLESMPASFLSKKKEFVDDFAETKRNIEADLREKGAPPINIELYPQLKSKIETNDKIIRALEKQKLQQKSLHDELLEELSTLNNLWLEEFKIIKYKLECINRNHTSLEIEVEYKGDKGDYLSFMKVMFKGSGIKEITFGGLVEKYADFGDMYQDFEKTKKSAGSSPETFERYFKENLQSLLSYQVPNKFTIKYRGKELQHHSLGQRASALILFVLNQQDNDVVIIDQPEDDLDNQTIYEDVIKLITELKRKTQFIFATHNANIPVLGDAEQIHSCKYSDNDIQVKTGSIDSSDLQKEIVNIMEGGKEAFRKRKEIYSIWKYPKF